MVRSIGEIGEKVENYDNDDVINDDFTEHKEHQGEDLCRKSMNDMQRPCRICEL